MGKVSYSTRGEPAVEQLLNTAIDINTLAPGDGLIWDATNEVWVNGAGGGGGGVTGTDDHVLFKQGGIANTFTNGISRDPTDPSMTINLDTASKRVGINKQNPTTSLDVGGNSKFTSSFPGTDTTSINGNLVGVITGTNALTLYSSNLPAVASGTTTVDSTNKKTSSSAWRSYDPDAFDTPNTTDTDSIYKVKLQLGMDKELGGGVFDIQEDYNTLGTGFPTGQVTEYQNKMNINNPIIIGRVATGAVVGVASVYTISSFGAFFGAPFFHDRCYYDPMQMRSRKSGSGWVWAGAPTVYRVSDTKVGWTIKWYFEGIWASSNTNNRLHMYCNQYRNGSLFRTFLVGVSNNADTCFMNGERTFAGWQGFVNEDFDVLTDDWLVEVANQGQHDITVNLAQVELRCWLAQ